MAFFPGLKGDPGIQGPPGADSIVPGPIGPAGGVGVYVGAYVAGTVYYSNEFRHDIVAYAGRFWITNEPAKNGLNTWDAPNVDNWADFGTTLVMVATALELLTEQNIAVGLNIQAPGFIQSDNYDAGLGTGWLLTAAGALVAYDGLLAGKVSTDSPRFNLDRPMATMPAVAYAEFNIPAILDAAIPENPTINNVTDNALIFSGWGAGALGPNSFYEERFGNTQQKFTISLEGTGTNTSAGSEQFFIQLYYRTRLSGGAWDPWVVLGLDWYMNKLAALEQSYQLVRDLSIALVADNDIQFSAGFSKGVGGTAAVAAAKISVKAYN